MWRAEYPAHLRVLSDLQLRWVATGNHGPEARNNIRAEQARRAAEAV